MHPPLTESRPTVLLIEDDQPLLETMIDVLVAHGWAVVGWSQDAVSAIAMLARQPDLTLVDYQLKDGPCDEVIQKLVELRVPFAVISAYEPEDLPTSLQSHVHLHKPFDLKTLLDTMQRVRKSL